MSKDIEKKDLPNSEQLDEKKEALHQLLAKISDALDAPKDLVESLQKMSDDPNFYRFLEENEINKQEKEATATQYTEQIRSFFDAKQWHYTTMDAKGRVFLLNFKTRNSTVRLQIAVESQAECISFDVSILSCQEEYRMAMSDYLTQLNMPLRYGAFHLDKDDGAVTYRYSTFYKGLPFNADAFEIYINACIITVDQTSKEIGKIAYGRFSDEEKKEWFKKIRQLAVALSQ